MGTCISVRWDFMGFTASDFAATMGLPYDLTGRETNGKRFVRC